MLISLLLGPLIGVLILLVVRVQHDITLPYCESCWSGFKKANLYETTSLLSFFGAFIIGLVLLLNFDSVLALFVPVTASIALIVWAQRNKKRVQPRFKKVDRKQAVVSAGRYGDVVFSKATKATVPGGSSW